MTRRKVLVSSILLILLILGVVWVRHLRANAQVERMKQMQEQMFVGGRPDREKFDEFRNEMQKLNPAQRDQVRDHMQEVRDRHEAKRLKEFFDLPPDKRNEVLDKQIAQEEEWRKEREKRRAENAANPGQPGGRGQPSAGGGAGGGNGQPGNAGGPGGRGANRTPEAQSDRRNKSLDRTSPEQRAQRTAYRAALQQRRLQLGLPATPPRGGRGPGR